jgi:hypothetical protein
VRSLKARLLVLWLLTPVAGMAVRCLLLVLGDRSTAAQVGRGEAVVARACDLSRDRYGFYSAGWSGLGAGTPDAAIGSAMAFLMLHGARPGILGSTLGDLRGCWLKSC